MNKLAVFLRRHWPGILVAVVVGTIMVLPALWLSFELGESYRGIAIADVDNDHFYLARISAAYEGDLKITQATMAGEENVPYTSPPLGELTVAGLAHLLGLSPAQMVGVGNFLFPFLLALIFYFLIWQITKSRLVAALVPLVILTSSNFLFEPREILDLFFKPQDLRVNVYNRPIHPQVSSLFFYSWLLVFYSWLVRPRRWLLILAGLLFGALFYVYPYSWILAAVILGVLALGLVLRKDYSAVKGILGIFTIGALVSVGSWLNSYQFSQHPLFEVMKKRFVLFASRKPLWSDLLFLDLTALVLYYWKKPRTRRVWFLFSVFIALWIVINQQVITGIRLFPGHWHWYYVVPLTIGLWLYLFWRFLRRFPKLTALAGALIVIVALINGVVSQRVYFEQSKDKYVSYQRYAEVYNWLSLHVPAQSVVLADRQFSERLPVYTPLLRYVYQPTDELFLIPTEQLRQSFFVRLYLEGVREENLEEYLNQDTPEFQELLFGYYRRYANGCVRCYTKEEIEEVRRLYRQFLQSDFEKELKKYRVDYAVWDPQGSFVVDFDQFGFLRPLAEINGIKIYQVK